MPRERLRPAAPIFELFDEVFGEMFGDFHQRVFSTARFVPVNGGKKFVLRVSAPGFEMSDFNDIDVVDRSVRVKGSHKFEDENRTIEIDELIRIPAGANANELDASIKNGILTLTMPSVENSKNPRKVRIKEG